MAKKKACKKCKMIVTGEQCPNCKSDQFSTNFQGRVYIVDPNKSIVGQNMGFEAKGEYAIKVR